MQCEATWEKLLNISKNRLFVVFSAYNLPKDISLLRAQNTAVTLQLAISSDIFPCC